VVRNGVELDQVFTVKKEADAYDKMLDAADNLAALIKEGDLEIDLDGKTIETISVFLSKNGPEVSKILRGIKPFSPPAETNPAANSITGEEKKPAQPKAEQEKKKVLTPKPKAKGKKKKK